MREFLSSLLFRDYGRYMQSRFWRWKSRTLRKSVGRCKICGRTHSLQVHHNSYDRMGLERRHDLTALCRKCHMAVHTHIWKRKKR